MEDFHLKDISTPQDAAIEIQHNVLLLLSMRRCYYEKEGLDTSGSFFSYVFPHGGGVLSPDQRLMLQP